MNFPIRFHTNRKHTKSYRGPRCNPTQAQSYWKSMYMSPQIFKQEVQCLIPSVKANLELFRSAKSTFLSSDIRKQAACICLLQSIWNTATKPPCFFCCSSHTAMFSCSTSPLLFLLHHFQIPLGTFSFAQAYKRSWFPSLPIYFSPYLSP